jgi:putative oxidoreductase
MFQKLIRTSRVWFTLPLRLALGAVFVAHGAQKVLGLWGGPGLAQFTSGQAPLGLRPAWFWLGAAALAELVGGALVLAGLMTRVGAFLLLSVMLVAMFGVHWSGGFFLSNTPMPGIEYTLALAAMALALLVSGGGRLSLDEALMDPRYRRR